MNFINIYVGDQSRSLKYIYSNESYVNLTYSTIYRSKVMGKEVTIILLSIYNNHILLHFRLYMYDRATRLTDDVKRHLGKGPGDGCENDGMIILYFTL